MRYEDEDFTEGLQQATRGAKPARGRRWSGGGGGGWGSLKERVSAAKGSPQAVFKISSYSRSSSAVWDRVNYVARDGEIEVEMPNGEEISQQELGRLVEEWSADAEEGGRGRIAMAAVVSFPDGVDKEQATEAARQFFAEAFGKNHDYVFAAHEDAKQFHVHVVVQVAGADGKQLRISKDDIQDLRVLLAEKAREQGIELDASPRWARGLEPEERKRQEEEGRTLRVGGGGKELHIEKNKFTNGPEHPERPVRENAGARAAREALSAERARGQQEPGGALEYARAAAALASQISQREQPQEKVAAVKGAVQLATAGWKLTEQGIGKAEDLAAARIVIDRVDKSINAQIRGLEKGRSQKAAITARRSLAGCLVEYRKAEREKGREAESRESRTEAGTPAEEKTTARAGGAAEEPDKGREPESRESRTEDGTPAEEKTPEPAERPAEEPDKGREPESRESRTEDGTPAEEKTAARAAGNG